MNVIPMNLAMLSRCLVIFNILLMGVSSVLGAESAQSEQVRPIPTATATPTATVTPEGAELLESMKDRLPAVMKLKLSGKIGETNRGLLEARESLAREERRLVADENRDRLAYFNLLARRLEVPIEQVQRARAEQIRRESPQGVWVQAPGDGAWLRQ